MFLMFFYISGKLKFKIKHVLVLLKFYHNILFYSCMIYTLKAAFGCKMTKSQQSQRLMSATLESEIH